MRGVHAKACPRCNGAVCRDDYGREHVTGQGTTEYTCLSCGRQLERQGRAFRLPAFIPAIKVKYERAALRGR